MNDRVKTERARTLQGKANYSRSAGVAWLFVLGLMILTACATSTSYSETDRIAIYSAVIQRIYTQDDTFGGTLNPPVLYIVRMTDDTVGDPGIERSEPEPLSAAVQNGISQTVADLPTRIVWVDDADQVPLDPTTGALTDKGVIITLGNIHFQDDGSALVSGSIYIALLAAGGQTYVVEQVSGAWEVTGNTGAIWMS